jgi:CDP-diglyceride synthetase
MMSPRAIVQLLVLLSLANGTPVLAKRLLRDRWAYPLDGGIKLADGQPLFGPSKTLRGLVLALAMTSGLSPLFGLSWKVGAVVAAGAMAGDLASSFLKRRMKLAPSSMALGLDQIPESLVPAILLMPLIPLTILDVLLATALFFFGELVVSRILYRLKVRDRPY